MRSSIVVGSVVLAVAVAGCGGAGMRSTASAPVNAEPSTLLGPDAIAAHDEITALMERTDRDLTELGASPIAPMPMPTPQPGAMTSVPDIVRSCAPPLSPPAACADVTTIAERVCDAATRICDLADQLPGDDWASERCNAGTESCRVAHQRSCDCQ